MGFVSNSCTIQKEKKISNVLYNVQSKIDSGLKALLWVLAVGFELMSIRELMLRLDYWIPTNPTFHYMTVFILLFFFLLLPGQRGSGWSDVFALLLAHCGSTDHHGDKGTQPESHGYHWSFRFGHAFRNLYHSIQKKWTHHILLNTFLTSYDASQMISGLSIRKNLQRRILNTPVNKLNSKQI